RDLRGFIEILGVDQVVAAELLARFGERAVGRLTLAVADTNGRRCLRWMQAISTLVVPALRDALGERHVLAAHRLGVGFAHLRPVRFVAVDQQEVLHGSVPRVVVWLVLLPHQLVEWVSRKSTDTVTYCGRWIWQPGRPVRTHRGYRG